MSKLNQIKEKLAQLLQDAVIEEKVEMGAAKTDKAVLEFDGEELKAGMSVFVTNEKGERVPAENGEYVTEDGKTVVVADGKAESITDPLAEVDEDDVDENIEGADETADEKPAEEGDKPAEEKVEAEDEVDAVAELRKEVDELYKIVDSILEKVGESRREADERFSKLEKMSLAKPADEAFEDAVVNTNKKTGDAAIDKRLERMKQMNKDWRS